MKSHLEVLKENTKSELNPSIIADETLFFVSDTLRTGALTLFEGFLLNDEILFFRRQAFVQPAWANRPSVSTCVALLNQYLLAKIFDLATLSEKYKTWGMEAFEHVYDGRKHYLMDHFSRFFDEPLSHVLLNELSYVRSNYLKLSDDLGPFHVESFPFEFFSPEGIILGKNDLPQVVELGEETEEALIWLSLKH